MKTPVSANTILTSQIRDFFFIMLGIVLYVIGYVGFQLPYQITPGGVAGISALVYYATGLHAQYTYLFINATLLLIALKLLGLKFLINTIFAVGFMTVTIAAAQDLIVQDDGTLPRLLGDQSFMACVVGACVEGIGLGIVFLNNGSTGGTDIVAACINKYRDMSLGQVLLICDIIVCSCSYLIFQKIDLLLYGYVSMIVETSMLDYVMNRMRESVQFFIISNSPDQIAKAINDFGRGVTLLDASGWYTGKQLKVLMVLTRRRESTSIFRCIKQIDPHAFVTQSKVVGVFGNGFDKIKGK